MSRADTFTTSLFTMRHLKNHVPKNHPLRLIRQVLNENLVKVSALALNAKIIAAHLMLLYWLQGKGVKNDANDAAASCIATKHAVYANIKDCAAGGAVCTPFA